MGDVFIEYLVKRKSTPKIVLAKVGIILTAIFASTLAMTLSPYLGSFSALGLAACVAALYGGYYFFTSMSVEFEYSVTNGEMDVDIISARRKRRRLATVNFRDAESFGRYNQAEHTGMDYDSLILACDSPGSPNVWYIAAHIKDKGRTLIVFNASERMLSAIKPFLPGRIARGTLGTADV